MTWKTYKWGDLISLEYGKPIHDKNLLDGQYPVYGTNGKIGTSNLPPLCKHSSIIVGRKGAYRGVHYSNKPFSVIDTAFFVEPKTSTLDLKWAYYKLLTVDINKMDSGSAIPSTDRYEIYSLPVELPPLAEQKRIAAILGALDDKIELNRRINANLEEQAQALFKSWFVDFEPFRDGPFIDSELGKIPKGWKVGTINEIIQILSGFAFKSGTFSEDGPYQLITIKNVQDGNLNVNGAVHISEIPDRMPLHCKLYIGDILLSLTGNVGRVSIVDQDSLLLNQRVAKLRPKDKRNTFFTYTLFRQDNFKQYLIQIAKGTAQLNLSPIEIGETKIILPNHDLLSQFGEIGQPLFDRIVSNSREIITLSTLRDTLLPKLMAGEIAIE